MLNYKIKEITVLKLNSNQVNVKLKLTLNYSNRIESLKLKGFK